MNSNDRANLIKRINTLEGLTDKERSALLGLLRENKTYGLVWEDKPEDVEERLRDELPILTEVPERAIISEDKDAPNHILIEGDNLEALATLAYTHEGKIDVIYIDPPYNTGNKDFIYNDSYVDKEDSYRHSKWLSFMGRRLKIAKKLLSDRGVIFISIDDNEQAQLKMLCDEILHNIDFVATIPWRKRTAKSDVPHYLSQDYEWILCFVIAVVLALIVRYYIGTPTEVRMSSMFPTLHEGERLWLSRLGRTTKKLPNRGDIVTFEAPSKTWVSKEEIDLTNPVATYENEPQGFWNKFAYYVLETSKTSYIKRVIGLPGDYVEIKDGAVYINGEKLQEDYLQSGVVTDMHQDATHEGNFTGFTVPENCVFCLGDNRTGSRDCRSFGCIPLEKIEGKVLFRFWPLNKFGKV